MNLTWDVIGWILTLVISGLGWAFTLGRMTDRVKKSLDTHTTVITEKLKSQSDQVDLKIANQEKHREEWETKMENYVSPECRSVFDRIAEDMSSFKENVGTLFGRIDTVIALLQNFQPRHNDKQ